MRQALLFPFSFSYATSSLHCVVLYDRIVSNDESEWIRKETVME